MQVQAITIAYRHDRVMRRKNKILTMQRGHNTRLDTELSDNRVLLGSEDNVTCTKNKVSCTRDKA
jgi:hypothetical protein